MMVIYYTEFESQSKWKLIIYFLRNHIPFCNIVKAIVVDNSADFSSMPFSRNTKEKRVSYKKTILHYFTEIYTISQK